MNKTRNRSKAVTDKWSIIMNKRIMRRIILAIVLMVTVSLLPLNCFAYTGFTNTPLRGQETVYCCWAASCQMLLETQGIIKTQTQIAGSDINNPADAYGAHQKLIACAPSIQWDLIYNSLSMNSVENTIDLGWAIYCNCFDSFQYSQTHNSVGHAMVVTGYKRGQNEVDKVWLQDPMGLDNTAPYDGIEGWVNYSTLINGTFNSDPNSSYFSQWQGRQWTDTIC